MQSYHLLVTESEWKQNYELQAKFSFEIWGCFKDNIKWTKAQSKSKKLIFFLKKTKF